MPMPRATRYARSSSVIPARPVDVAIDDPGPQQRRVEPVAGVGEVGLGGGGPQPGVDADEQQPEAGPDQVGDRGVAVRLELGPGESHQLNPISPTMRRRRPH